MCVLKFDLWASIISIHHIGVLIVFIEIKEVVAFSKQLQVCFLKLRNLINEQT